MKIEIISKLTANTNLGKIKFTQIKQWLKIACKELKKHPLDPNQLTLLKKDLRIVFVDKEEMQRLNKQFRKKDKATDILSFAPTEDSTLGELVLCWPVICEKAKKKTPKMPLPKWLYWLTLHGLLHLLGFEHEQGGEEARKMYQLQEQIFEKVKKE